MNEMQQQAVTAQAPCVLVSAGAGSGKTRVLTERYLDLLQSRGIKIEQILTLTFTRKAAQEMRERIARALEAQGKVYERRELTRAPIGTIHSFCERVLREHALEAGIDPNFRLLDEAEARTMQENALDATFEKVWMELRRQDEELGHLLLEFPNIGLRESLLDIYSKTRVQGIPVAEILPAAGGDSTTASGQLCAAVEALLALTGTAKWQQALLEAEFAYRELTAILQAAQQEFTWDHYYRAQELLSPLTPRGGPKNEAKAARDAIKAAMECWLGTCLDRIAQPFLRAFLQLLRLFDHAYRQAKDDQGLLDFNDLLLITRDLLTTATGGAPAYLKKRFSQVMVDEFQDTNPLQFDIIRALQGDGHLFMVGDVKQAIYRFIGSDVRVFLGQEEWIKKLPEAEGRRITMAENYRSRPEVLGVLNGFFAQLWPEDEDAVKARNGFRFEPLSAGAEFAPKAIPCVEMAFWGEADDNAAALRDREAAWIARRILQLTGKLGEPALQITDRRDDPDAPLKTHAASYQDIILLFRAATDIPRYEDALRQAGIPYYVVSGRGFYQTREVQDLVFMLRVLDNPLDDFALAVVLRSPLVGVSDDTLYWLSRDWSEWQIEEPYPAHSQTDPPYGRLWENFDRLADLPITEGERQALAAFRETVFALQVELPAGQPLELIDLIIARTHYTTVLLAMEGGEQRYANIQKLREVASDFQGRGIFDLADFQRYLTKLETLSTREASAPLEVEASQVVRLMTIHASKGLEAPIVFLADCGREQQRTFARFLLVGKTLACQVPTPESEWVSTAGHTAGLKGIAVDDGYEAERLLYVALTRAREHLICCGSSKFPETPRKTSYADTLIGLLGLTEQATSDTDLPVSYDGVAYPVCIWSAASLAAVECLQPPPQPLTLWEEYPQAILAGKPLPLLAADEVERFSRIVARLQQLPRTRREGPLRIGVNRAICYEKCPRQYWFRYLLRGESSLAMNALPPMTEAPTFAQGYDLQMPDEAEEDRRDHVDGTAFGQLLHGVLQRVDFGSDLPAQAGVLHKQVAGEYGLPVAEADHEQITACLQRLQQLPVYRELTRAATLHRELRFLARIGEVYVPGIIDVLACTDDQWWILDYKTGRPSADHLRQVAIYALGVQQALAVTPARLRVLYLDGAEQRWSRDEPVTQALFDDAIRIIRAAGEGITNENYHPKPGRLCEYCPFLGGCPEGQGAAIPAGPSI